MSPLIDLHLHSVFSDGTDTPADIADAVAAQGAGAFALTDHDSVTGLKDAADAAAARSLQFIRGVELSVSYVHHGGQVTLHLLGLDLAETVPESFTDLLASNQGARDRRNHHLAGLLERLGYKIEFEEMEQRLGGRSIGRAHFGAELVARGHFETIDAAFDLLLGPGCPGYLRQEHANVGDAIDAIHAAGGVAVLAHPLRTLRTMTDTARAVDELCDCGLDGIEAVYSEYSPSRRQVLAAMAQRFGLIVTGGSDYHGTNKPHLQPVYGKGDLAVGEQILGPLHDRAQHYRSL